MLLFSLPVSKWRKSGVQGTRRSPLRAPHLSFLFWGPWKGCPAIAEGRPVPRSRLSVVSATRLLVKVLDWGALCPPSTTDSPSRHQPPLDPPEAGHSLRNISFPRSCLSQPPLHLCADTGQPWWRGCPGSWFISTYFPGRCFQSSGQMAWQREGDGMGTEEV